MKKKLEKWTAVLLVFGILLGALPIGAAAQGGISPSRDPEAVISEGDGESGYVLRQSTEQLGENALGSSAEPLYADAAPAYDDGTLYSQLTERQKECFNEIEALSINRIIKAAENKEGYKELSVRIGGIYGIQLSGTIKGANFTVTPSSESASKQASIYTDLLAAITALRYDRADLLWTADMLYGYKWVKEKTGVVKVTDVLVAFKLQYDGQEKKMWEAMNSRAKEIVGQIDISADTYTQVKALHDLLAEGNTYNTTPVGKMDEALSHTAYSALIPGDAYEPVCEGYAKAFKVVCDLLEIPCVLASSSTHMWNNIKMDDGDWYNLDLTWDDPNDVEISYNYFLVGSQTEINGQAFNKQPDHVEENPYKKKDGHNAVTLRFPTKNKKAYEYLGQDYTPLRFPDVKRSTWYYQYVEDTAANGLFNGDKNGLFYPSHNITRAEFTQVMANSMGVDLSSYREKESSFSDVEKGKWYTAPIVWAKEIGLMKGYGDFFRPNAPISREEMCVVFFNAIKDRPERPGFQFPDDGKISKWAKEGVYTCYALGLVKGDNQGNFSPKANTLRSEAATVFSRYMGL